MSGLLLPTVITLLARSAEPKATLERSASRNCDVGKKKTKKRRRPPHPPTHPAPPPHTRTHTSACCYCCVPCTRLRWGSVADIPARLYNFGVKIGCFPPAAGRSSTVLRITHLAHARVMKKQQVGHLNTNTSASSFHSVSLQSDSVPFPLFLKAEVTPANMLAAAALFHSKV